MYSQGNPNALKILYDIFHIIERRGHYGHRRNWEMLVELVADHEGIIVSDHDDLSCDTDIENLIMRYKIAAKKDPWDYLGEIFGLENLGGMGQLLTPRTVVQCIVKMTFLDTLEKIQTILEPALGTGRFLIEVNNLFPNAPLILFGIEIDLWLYRASMVNMKMFSQHPFGIVCADFLAIENCGPTSPIWDHGTYWTGATHQYKWMPEDMTPFYWKKKDIPQISKKISKSADKIDESQMALSIIESD